MHRILRGFAALIAVAAIPPSVVAAAPAPAGSSLTLKTIASVPPAREHVAGMASLTSGSGVVAWVELSKNRTEQRVALLKGAKIVRTAWFLHSVRPNIRRDVDVGTGKVVTRVSIEGCGGETPCTERWRSATTLRPTATTFPAHDGKTVVDGLDRVTAAGPSVDLLPADPACTFTSVAATQAIPSISDCAEPTPSLQGRILLVSSSVASQTTFDHASTDLAWNLLDLGAPALSWRTVETGGYGKGGIYGPVSTCLLDDGVVFLEGSLPNYEDVDPSSWFLKYVPLDPAKTGWRVPAPQFAPPPGVYERAAAIACSDRSIYGLVQRNRDPKTESEVAARIVRVSLG